MTSSGNGRMLCLDIDHTVEQLMTAAVARISSRVRVHVDADRVLVSGTVNSWHEKQLVQESLRAVSPSYRISNEISVNAWT